MSYNTKDIYTQRATGSVYEEWQVSALAGQTLVFDSGSNLVATSSVSQSYLATTASYVKSASLATSASFCTSIQSGISAGTSGTVTIALSQSYSNTNYSVVATTVSGGANYYQISNKTTSSFDIIPGMTASSTFQWIAVPYTQ